MAVGGPQLNVAKWLIELKDSRFQQFARRNLRIFAPEGLAESQPAQ
jgi:hypothetical protein